MSTRHLDAFFQPNHVAFIGATNQPRKVGGVAMRNLIQGHFSGRVMPVNPKYESVAGLPCYANVESLPVTPELAIIATPVKTVPGIVRDLAKRGTKAVVLFTDGLDDDCRQSVLHAAKPHLMRIMGSDSVGLVVPFHGLFASFVQSPVLPGHLAFVSQSGSLATAVLDWAHERDIGFSHCVSLGATWDVDFGDLLDYLANDRHTHAILLYIERLDSPRKFLSAARAAARNKPVIVIKASSARSGMATTDFAARMEDRVMDAALRRAGTLRVYSVDALFDAVETLARTKSLPGERLAILSNGSGPGFLALDALRRRDGAVAELSDSSRQHLTKVLGNQWFCEGMVNVGGDADADRYGGALATLLSDSGVDAVLTLVVPAVIPDSEAVVRRIVHCAAQADKAVISACMGGAAAANCRKILTDAGLATFDTPEHALRAFRHMVDYQRNRESLMETPPAWEDDRNVEREDARSIMRQALAASCRELPIDDTLALLRSYGLETTRVVRVLSVKELAARADDLGFPVRIQAELPHHPDGGQSIDVANASVMEEMVSGLVHRLERDGFPDVVSYWVRHLVRRPQAFALTAGIMTDPTFGPVVYLGHGGPAADYLDDYAIGLPPLNVSLARDLIARTKVSKLLQGDAARPAANCGALARVLVRLAQLLIDLPQVMELHLKTLLLDSDQAIVSDASLILQPDTEPGPQRLAIRPYPEELEETIGLADGRQVLLRPIRPEDEPAQNAFFERLGPEDIRFRFFLPIREIPHEQMARYTQIDYDREMAFVAVDKTPTPYETLGVVRAVTDPDNRRAEFAVIIRPDMKRKGLGSAMMKKIIRYCRERGTRYLAGQIMLNNTAMLRLASKFGFRLQTDEDTKQAVLDLQA